MDFSVKIIKIRSIDRIEGAWTFDDYVNLLELFDYADAKNTPELELFDMLSMAMSDFEPEEAAEIVLTYKLGDRLKSGQIKNLSHEMLEEKVAEDYADISMHYPLFNINQLLNACFNGKFPRTIASVIDFELKLQGNITVTKEVVIRTMSDLLSQKSLLKRLFNEQLDASHELKDAESIIWELKPMGENNYQLISSDYWLNREDFEFDSFSGALRDDEIKR
jgi:hypothetical protein